MKRIMVWCRAALLQSSSSLISKTSLWPTPCGRCRNILNNWYKCTPILQRLDTLSRDGQSFWDQPVCCLLLPSQARRVSWLCLALLSLLPAIRGAKQSHQSSSTFWRQNSFQNWAGKIFYNHHNQHFSQGSGFAAVPFIVIINNSYSNHLAYRAP